MGHRTLLSAGVFLVATVCMACTTGNAVEPYVATANTYVDMQGLRHATDRGIQVGRFTFAEDGPEVAALPGASVETPDGRPFSTYIRDALASELKTAGVYSDSAPVVLTGSIEAIRFSRGSSQSQWQIVLTVYSSNGISVQIDERHDFGEKPWDGFMPAVQELIAKLVHDPKFKELVSA
jgi:hypothetical protein